MTDTDVAERLREIADELSGDPEPPEKYAVRMTDAGGADYYVPLSEFDSTVNSDGQMTYEGDVGFGRIGTRYFETAEIVPHSDAVEFET